MNLKSHTEASQPLFLYADVKEAVMELRFCKIKDEYIRFLHKFDERVLLPKKENQINDRKYIGTLFKVGEINYYVNLSSFKDKHKTIKESLDFIKIGELCVLNLNNMIPVSDNVIIEFDINKEEEKYRFLLFAERKLILKKKALIYKNSEALYKYISKNCGRKNDKSVSRCCDFKKPESAMNGTYIISDKYTCPVRVYLLKTELIK